MIKRTFLVLSLTITSLLSETIDNTELFDSLIQKIQTTKNSNLPDEIKLQKIQEYVSKLKLQKKKI